MKPEAREAAERLAETFHERYERPAPQFGYETRPDTRTFDPSSDNGKLMLAVCGEILEHWPLAEHPVDDDEPVTEEWLESVGLPAALSGRAQLTISPSYTQIEIEQADPYYGFYEEIDLPHCKSRGDVRKLAAALGVELKERQ